MKVVPITEFIDKNTTGLSTYSDEDLSSEIQDRERKVNRFPLEVFHPKIKPFIDSMVTHLDVPKSYVGLSMLSVYSTAIGSSFNVSMNGNNKISLAIWACMEGISSSGKSLSIDMCYKPLSDIQEDFDREWTEKTGGMAREKLLFEKLKTVIYRDAHIATLVRSVMPDNPKGVLKDADEILEWINGMNQMNKKEGTDEQFWLSTWNGKGYSGIRSGKDKFVLPRPFVNVVGGVQPTITYKLFAKDRDTTGFIFRLLFAVPDKVRIASPDHTFSMGSEVTDIHKKTIRALYFGLPVEDPYDDARMCLIDREAIQVYYEWEQKKKKKINGMSGLRDIEIHSGILGKIKEYVLRFSALLKIADRAYDNETFSITERVDVATMKRAIKLGDYFYQSAADVSDRVNQSVTAPIEVVQVSALVNSGRSYEYIANNFYMGKITRQSVNKRIAKWVVQYPNVFRAKEKT